MFGPRKHAGTHVARVIAEGTFDGATHFGISLHEPGCDLADEVAEHVVRDDELPVHVGTGANPVDEHAGALAHERRRLCGHSLEQNREHARSLQCLGVTQQALRGRQRFPLHAVAAELTEALRRETQMTHHGNARIDHRAHASRDARAPFALHRVAPRGHECPGAADRGFVGGLVGQERQVADHERALCRARHRPNEHQHFGHSDLERTGESEHRHGRGIAHQDHVDARAIGECRGRIVVGGDEHRFLIAVLQPRQRGDRDFACGHRPPDPPDSWR